MNATTTETTIQTLAKEAYDALETRTRNDGTVYVCRKDDAPEWVESLCHHAHENMMPDDLRYEFIESALGIIADEDEDNYTSALDNATDVYNSDLLKWVSSNLTRAQYVDEGVEEYGWSEDRGLFGALAVGQYRERDEVLNLCLSFLRDLLSAD